MKVVFVKIFHVQHVFFGGPNLVPCIRLDFNLEHAIFNSSFASLILSLLMVFTKSLGCIPHIMTCWTDFETSVNATHSKPFAMLDALLWLMLLMPHIITAYSGLPGNVRFSALQSVFCALSPAIQQFMTRFP